MKYNRNAVIGAIILAVAIIIAFIFAVKNKKVEAPVDQSSGLSKLDISKDLLNNHSIYTSSNLGKATDTTVSTNPDLSTATLTYTNAFMKFRGSNIIQLGDGCQAHPTSIVVPNNSQMLLDNRADNSEVITIGNTKYDLAPYGYKVITLDIPKVPATYTVDCKVAQNVTTLTVE
ncbi:MAG: hypothetical protein KGI58_00930 [Patescibacteria group bacterium]|nr:hypothetical protein [Patescibacteria group bacterium]